MFVFLLWVVFAVVDIVIVVTSLDMVNMCMRLNKSVGFLNVYKNLCVCCCFGVVDVIVCVCDVGK